MDNFQQEIECLSLWSIRIWLYGVPAVLKVQNFQLMQHQWVCRVHNISNIWDLWDSWENDISCHLNVCQWIHNQISKMNELKFNMIDPWFAYLTLQQLSIFKYLKPVTCLKIICRELSVTAFDDPPKSREIILS